MKDLNRVKICCLVVICFLLGAATVRAQSGPQESEIAKVTTEIAYLRQYNGALHLGVLFKNTADSASPTASALRYAQVTLIENGRKHFPLKDEAGHYLAGPVADWNDGGRWFPHIERRGQVLVWAIFEPVQATKVDVNMPLSQPFDAVPVSTTPPPAGHEGGTVVSALRVSLTSASRAEGQLKIRIKIANSGGGGVSGPGIRYRDAYVLDPASKKKYSLMKDEDGTYLAQPRSDASEGGRYFLTRVPAHGQVFMILTFTAPPDTVKSVDIVVPELDPIENVAIAGQGGAADAGTSVTGRTIGLERALQDLHAEVTPQQVKVNLSADVLFDFDKADLKPAAEPDLGKVATVLKSYPSASVAIEGHTDAKGNDAYNQTLSEKRAAAVAQWLTSHGAATTAQIHTKGWGKAKPIATNTRPDGSDDPDGRAKNRRVEITVTK